MNDRNLGRFTVTNDLIRRCPDEAAQVFKMLNLVVVRAECIFADSLIEYTGISDQFVEIEVEIPENLNQEQIELFEKFAEKAGFS